jgi:predicted transposase/invertase (TIGR01784 family)
MIAEAERKGIEKGIKETAKKLKNMGLNIEDIIKATGLSKKQIEEL